MYILKMSYRQYSKLEIEGELGGKTILDQSGYFFYCENKECKYTFKIDEATEFKTILDATKVAEEMAPKIKIKHFANAVEFKSEVVEK